MLVNRKTAPKHSLLDPLPERFRNCPEIIKGKDEREPAD
jgi:hypothetical protein